MKKLRVGVIGCGRISAMHLVSADALEQADLVACCDIKKDRADAVAEKYNINAYTSYIEMLEKESLDAVHLCLPHYLHPKIARDCFKYGVNVLSEKPMDIDLDSAEAAQFLIANKAVAQSHHINVDKIELLATHGHFRRTMGNLGTPYSHRAPLLLPDEKSHNAHK